jgi:hypothetical protein
MGRGKLSANYCKLEPLNYSKISPKTTAFVIFSKNLIIFQKQLKK